MRTIDFILQETVIEEQFEMRNYYNIWRDQVECTHYNTGLSLVL